MTRTNFPGWLKPLWLLLIFALTVTGFAQMPLARRYYISEVPGLGWLADFGTVHIVHYLLAALFLFVAGWTVAAFFRMPGRPYLTASGKARLAILAVVIVSGMLRVLKNDPGVTFGYMPTLFFDLTHLVSVMLLGIAALVAKITGKSPYLRRA